jgi:hypothetical protein
MMPPVMAPLLMSPLVRFRGLELGMFWWWLWRCWGSAVLNAAKRAKAIYAVKVFMVGKTGKE